MKRVSVATSNQGFSFLDILLDERICAGTVIVDKELVRKAGGLNKGIRAKQKYELLLRIALETNIIIEDIELGNCVSEVSVGMERMLELSDDRDEELALYGWQTDCYVIGKYSSILQETGYFEMSIAGILQEAQIEGREEQTISYLEKMIGRASEYYKIDDETRPILIYKGDPICHNVLTVFAEQLGNALENAGELIEYFDLQKEDVKEVLRYKDKHFKAIIGVQSYMFSIKMLDEVHYLHEYIYGPKYNFIFDHPVWVKRHLMHDYSDFYVLTHDSNYVTFAEQYFHKRTMLFPPAGMESKVKEELQRCYDISFVGTYGDYWEQLMWIHEQKRPYRFWANRFLLIMRKHPNLTAEDAFREMLKHYQMELSEEDFLDMFFELRRAIYCVMHYYRDRVVRTILKSGIRVDVFGDSWKNCRLAKYPNLICHPNVTVEESLDIWKQSKLSLNVMSWHKAGFTERMSGVMLAGAVLVTDKTFYLEGRYDDKDMLIFDLENLKALPGQIKRLLEDEELRKHIAESGREKTKNEHTWEKRATQFIEMLVENRGITSNEKK